MLQARKSDPDHLEAVERLTAWTRERFKLPDDAPILVAEVTCALPGCPPLETVIAFWTGNDQRHQLKIFKRIAEVVSDDLPPSWMKNALAVDEDASYECC